jgi:hypothetical protein
VRDTLTITALITADPPSLQNGDRLGEDLATSLPILQAEIDAARADAQAVRRAPHIPHRVDAEAAQHVGSPFWLALSKGRLGTVCGFPDSHPVTRPTGG